MQALLLRWAVNAVALWVAAELISGIELADGLGRVLVVALIFGLVNALIKPLAQLLSLPLIILTVGLFALVVNALMLLLTDAISDALTIENFWYAVLGAVVISLVSWALSAFVPERRPARQSR
jgi:putative membrane protein